MLSRTETSNTHVKRKAPARPFECEICRRHFARCEHLKRHRTTHTNEKPFVCFCGKSFARKDLLKRHEQIGKHLSIPSSSTSSDSGPTPTSASTSDTVPSSFDTPSSLASNVQQQQISPNGGVSVHDEGILSIPNGGLLNANAFQNFEAFLSTMGMDMPMDFDMMPDFADMGPGAYGQESFPFLEMPPTDEHADDPQELRPLPCPWRLTELQRNGLIQASTPYLQQYPPVKWPSRQSFSRYITGYFDDPNNHLPFLHAPTLRPQECPGSPELVIAMSATGALSKYEKANACRLFNIGKHITLRRWEDEFHNRVGANILPLQAWARLRNVQAAVLLTTFSFVECKPQSLNSASLRDMIHVWALENNPSEPLQEDDWHSWIYAESLRRTKCMIFCVFNMYTVVLECPPSYLGTQLDTLLPCSTAEWTAKTETEWGNARFGAPQQLHFHQAFSALFSSAQNHLHSPMANFVLMYGLLQRLYLARQMHLDCSEGPLRPADLDELEHALERWTLAWQQAPESILDPRNPDASNSFTSTSFLGLAHIRLHTNFSSKQQLATWDPELIARSIFQTPSPARSTRLLSPLLYAIQAIYIPVKVGVEYCSRSLFLHWDLLNHICHLEAAAFLTKWLLCIAKSHSRNPVRDCEMKVIRTVGRIVQEAEDALDKGDEDNQIGSSPATMEQDPAKLASDLAVRVTRVWVRLFTGHNSPWAVVDLIGRSLHIYADMLEKTVADHDFGINEAA